MQTLEHELQQESLMFLYLIHDLQLVVCVQNIITALKSKDDFAIIIALDI